MADSEKLRKQTSITKLITSPLNANEMKWAIEKNDAAKAVADQQYVPLVAGHIVAIPIVQYFTSLYRTSM